MKPLSKRKYELMSDCLKLFSQLPTNLQNYGRTSSAPILSDIIECCNKYTELATESQQQLESEIPLFHRFFCRIRDIIYASLTYYMHMHTFIHIRELLMEINKVLLQYRPGVGHHAVLLAISGAIRNCTTSMVGSKNYTKEQTRQLLQKYVKFQPKQEPIHYQPREITRKPIESITNRLNQTIKQKQSTEASLSKLFCMDSIPDIDYSNLYKFNTSTSEDLYNDCLNRNRFISQIMKRYSEKHTAYENKAPHRKNREGAEYKPTSYHIDSPTRSIKKRSIATAHNKTVSPNKEKEKLNLLNISDTFALADQASTQQFVSTGFKQDIINHLFAYRQKCCLRKIMIGAQDIQPSTTQTAHKETLRQFHRRNNKSSQAKSERGKTYSQRFHVLKNSKCYISGVVSVPFKRVDI